MPSIETGGVEKNFFLISNYLIKHYKNISIITLSKKHKNRFNKKIKFISLQSNFWDSLGKRKKFLICIFLLIAEILKGNSIVFSFQGNIYCTLICKLLFTKIIVRSNSSPEGWSNNFLKKLFYKLILNLANKTIVNSKIFKKQLKSKYNLDFTYIYNPLNVKEIDLLSKKKINIIILRKDF